MENNEQGIIERPPLKNYRNKENSIHILSMLVDNTDTGLYVSDFYTGEILFANKRFKLLCSHSVDEVIGKPCWSFINPDRNGRCPFCPYDKLVSPDGKPLGQQTWEKFFPHLNLWLKYINQVIEWENGRLVHMVMFYDITRTKEMQEQLTQIAFTDRHLQIKNASRLEADSLDMQSDTSLIFFDILALRKINDVYGREIGDGLLVSIRDWILSLNIPESELYRIGGDAFCLSIRHITPDDLKALSERLYHRFDESWIFKNNRDTLNIFCNVYMGIIHGSYIQGDEALLNLIERTLQVARRRGKIAIYDEAMNERFKKHIQLEVSLKHCILNKMEGFEVHYQPIADPVTGTWCGLEALCRWNSPELGPVSPIIFIHEAEQLGLIGTLGLWVLETAVHQCKRWGLDRHKRFVLDVNLSAVQFSDEMLMPKIAKILAKYSYPGEKLSLEITESTEFTFTDQSLNTLERMRENKILVALDDFGTGYSSFHNLKSLPVSILKTERAFITNIENDSYQQYLFGMMAELAHVADMKLIAEGVEKREQMDILLKHGADFLQGYLFSKPLPSAQLGEQLNRFYEIDKSFNIVRNQKIDMKELLGMESGYILTPNLYKILNQCMHILFYSTDTSKAVDDVLKIVGQHMNVSRTYTFLWDGATNTIQNTNEWYADGIPPQKEEVSGIILPEIWINLLKKDGIILASDVTLLPKEMSIPLEERGIKAIVIIPLWEGNNLFGFVGFDDNHYYRHWRPEEVLMLSTLAEVMANMANKQKLENEIILRGKIMDSVLNHIDMPVYVTDTQTGKILFANNHVQRLLGSSLEGGLCWEKLQGSSERCEFCRVDSLALNADESDVWEVYHELTQKHYRVYNSLIPWVNGEKVHLGYALDVTLLKESQKQLELHASTDAFTGTLNKASLIATLQSCLKKSHADEKPLAVCFVDIDNLKRMNDTYGHIQGDLMIRAVVKSFKKNFRKGDMIGRYGGDEFVIILPECTKEGAHEKMTKIRKQLKGPVPMKYSFSFGIAENTELSYQNSEHYAEKLIELADERMFDFKADSKI